MTETVHTERKAFPHEVREWARANGYTVRDRGRLSATLKQAFTAATGRPA